MTTSSSKISVSPAVLVTQSPGAAVDHGCSPVWVDRDHRRFACSERDGHLTALDLLPGRVEPWPRSVRGDLAAVDAHLGGGVTATYTSNGRWVLGHDAWAPSWSGGFLAGMMWIFAERSGESWWLEQAETYSRLVSSRKDEEGTHDIGFLLEPSFGQWYDWLKNDEARQVLIDGGRTMAGRFQPAGGYLSSWVDPGSTFIDIMMNVGIIFRAAAYTDDERLRE